MSEVTIEGSRANPSTFLAGGARVRVARTKYIDNLLRRGYVTLIAEHEPIHEPAPVFVNVEAAPAVLPEEPAESDPFGAPPVTALKMVWAKFLKDKGFGIADDATKAEMIAAWEASHGGTAD